MKKTESTIEDILLHDIIHITDYKTPKNRVAKKSSLKTLTKYPEDFKLTFSDNSGNVYKGICFIADFEGNLKFLNPSFLSDRSIEESWFLNRNLIDCIHPEDLHSAIEDLIKLIQENDSSISFKSRMGFGNKPYILLTWNVTSSGQLLFFDISETNFPSITTKKKESKKGILEDYYFDAIYWKLEVSKTLNAWDKNVLSYLDLCTEIKRK